MDEDDAAFYRWYGPWTSLESPEAVELLARWLERVDGPGVDDGGEP